MDAGEGADLILADYLRKKESEVFNMMNRLPRKS